MEELIKTLMSSLEIAELTGKRHDHVVRDIQNLNVSYDKINLPKVGEIEYADKRNRKQKAYQLTKMQTFDLMTGYNTELRIKVNRRWEELEKKYQKPMSTLDILEMTFKGLREQEHKVNELDSRLELLEAKNKTIPDYFTIAGFATIKGVECGLKFASNLGRKASKICREKGYQVEKVFDQRFGMVNSYPRKVLEAVFSQATKS